MHQQPLHQTLRGERLCGTLSKNWEWFSVLVSGICSLSYHNRILAWSTTDLERTDKLQHHIHTGDARPVRQSVRCIAPHRRDEVRQLLDDMLKRKVIELSSSP